MRRHCRMLLTFLFCLCLSANSAAHAQFIEKQTTNLQFLRGWDYELGPRERTIITIEHANKWKYGDFYAFADIIFPDGDSVQAYGELSPRLSLEKTTGYNPGLPFIEDLFIAGTYEKGDGNIRRYLAGVGTDISVPGFSFVKVNVYWRQDPLRSGSTYQTTLIWKRSFDLGKTSFVTEGFADFAGSEGDFSANQLIVPRFLLDVGALAGHKNRLFAGIEWQYWNNKFGVLDADESVIQFQLKAQL